MTDAPNPTKRAHAPTKAALTFDPQEYLHFLADCDWTEEQKREFIETLWQIIVSFVDLGFDLHPIQQVMDSPKTLEIDSISVLDSDSNLNIFEIANAGLDHLVGSGRPDS
jgi:hypothetical protein